MAGPPQYGRTLTQQEALSRGGPLHAQGPGDLTRWMGLPWQADTAFCRSGYDKTYDPYQPTFWPARVPNHVLTEPDYLVAIDPTHEHARRVEAFLTRADWNEPLQGDTAGQMEHMVRIFGSMGLVERRPGVPDDPDLPRSMWVASFGPDVPSPPPLAELAVEAAPRRPARRLTNWASDEEARQAPPPVRHSRD